MFSYWESSRAFYSRRQIALHTGLGILTTTTTGDVSSVFTPPISWAMAAGANAQATIVAAKAMRRPRDAGGCEPGRRPALARNIAPLPPIE
jgi:hypothetical protein